MDNALLKRAQAFAEEHQRLRNALCEERAQLQLRIQEIDAALQQLGAIHTPHGPGPRQGESAREKVLRVLTEAAGPLMLGDIAKRLPTYSYHHLARVLASIDSNPPPGWSCTEWHSGRRYEMKVP